MGVISGNLLLGNRSATASAQTRCGADQSRSVAIHYAGRSSLHLFDKVPLVLKTILAIVAIAILAGALQAQQQDLGGWKVYTPEFGEKFAAGKPACDLPRVTTDADFNQMKLPLDAGSFYLPREFSTQPLKRPSRAEWIAPDQTRLDVYVDSIPIGFMASNGINVRHSLLCALLIDGRHVVVDRVEITIDDDSHYLATLPIFAALGRVINTTIQAPSAERRDTLLAHLMTASLNKR